MEIAHRPRSCRSRAELGSISSSRCQTTRALGDAIASARNEISQRTSFAEPATPPSPKASAGNLRGLKSGPPTEAAIFQQQLAAKVGGARRDRTDDLLLAKQALSQLSYGPDRDQISVIGNQGSRIGLITDH